MKALFIENSYPNSKYELRGGANDIEVMLRLTNFEVTVLKDPSYRSLHNSFKERIPFFVLLFWTRFKKRNHYC